MSGSVGDFEKLFEDLDVKVEEMNGALDGVYSSAIDNTEVNDLLNEMKDDQVIREKDTLKNPTDKDIVGDKPVGVTSDIDEMQAKLDQLKNM